MVVTAPYSEMSQAALIAKIENQQEIIETQMKVIADLRWHDDIISNTDLPIAARFAARAVRKFTQTRKPCDDGYYKAYLPAMAQLAGVSPSTISRGLETLSDATEALDKHTEELRNERGHVEKNVLYFRTHESFDQAAEIQPIKDVAKHGGNRRLPCPECHCIHRRVKRREECAECGHKFFENERIIRGDEESLQDATTLEDEQGANFETSLNLDEESLQDATGESSWLDTNEGRIDLSLLPGGDSLIVEPIAPDAFRIKRASGESVGALIPIGEYEPEGDVVEANIKEPLQLATITINTRVASCNVLPPAELRALPIWCPWRYEEPEKPRNNGKMDKVPYQTQGRALQKAKPNDPTTWTTYDQALAIYEQSLREGWKRPFDGIGFMCDSSFVGIDLDHCRNKETGEIEPWAQSIIDRFPSYGYVTPSEEGVRIVIHAKKPGTHCKKGDIELYEEKRFFTWTLMQLPGTPETIEDCQEQLTALYDETFPPSTLSKEAREAPRVFTPSCQSSNEEILSTARGAANGPKFRQLYDEGDITGYASQSEAELALCGMLAYYSGSNEDAIDRLMRQWKLFRPEKWDRAARAGETYGQGTIRIAIEGLHDPR